MSFSVKKIFSEKLFKEVAAIIFLVCLLSVIQTAILLGQSSPRVGYEYWIPSSETDSAGQHGIHFKEFANGSAYEPKYPFSFQRWDEPQLGELKQRLNLEELIKDAPTEFETVRRIALMVCNLWAHSSPVTYPSWNALAILDEIDRGQQLWCTYKQLVTMQCLAALGIHSRIVPCHWHHSLEFWSNEYSKWVVMDAWTANFYRKDGIPLGALELCRFSRKTGDVKGSGVYEININPNRWKPDRTQDSVLADTPCYQYIRYIARNDFLSAPLEPKPAGPKGGYLQPNNQLNDVLQTGLLHIAWWEPGDAPTLVCPAVRYEQDFNFPLNEVEIALRRPADREGALDVSLATHTPEFDSFYRKVDQEDWAPCGSRFLWELNRLEVKSGNKWGRFGKPGLAVLEYSPEELEAPLVERLEITDPGFEITGSKMKDLKSSTAEAWRMIYTDHYQKPVFYGTVTENPHSGKYCFKIELGDPPVWGKLSSGRFRVNPAADVTLRVWLRADRQESEAAVFISDVSSAGPYGGPGRQAVTHDWVRVGREWKRYEIKARLTARTIEIMVGVQTTAGTVWVDDFSITEDRRTGLPW